MKKANFLYLVATLLLFACVPASQKETSQTIADHSDSPKWVKREEQVQIFAVRPLAEQLFFITDQNHYIFPINSRLTAVLQMPQRDKLDVATHRFEQVGDKITGDLSFSLRLADAQTYHDDILGRMGFKRTVDANIGDVWRLVLHLEGQVYTGAVNIPDNLKLNRPYNVYIYQSPADLAKNMHYPASPIQQLDNEQLFILNAPIWFTDRSNSNNPKKSGL